MAQRETGIVKWFDADKGFGFLAVEAGPDVFVGRQSVTLWQGDRISFERGPDRAGGGERAINVELLEPATLEPGRVKFFETAKGWGIIAAEKDGAEIFVSRKILAQHNIPSLGAGDAVEFLRHAVEPPNRPFATRLRVLP